MKTSTFVVSIVFLLGLAVFAANDPIRPDEIGSDHVGEDVTVEGGVYTTSKTRAGIHLYFGADTSTAFQALVVSSALHKFKVDIQKKYTRRMVRVTGKVEEENGRYFIRVEGPDQLKAVPRRRRN